MRKIKAILLLCFFLTLTSCSSNMKSTVSYKIETGDIIGITIDAKRGYSQTETVPFAIQKDNETVMTGNFIYIDSYEEYMEQIKTDPAVEIITESEKDRNQYVFFHETGMNEYAYLIQVADTETALILGGGKEQQKAEECFNSLQIISEKK